MKQHLRGDEHIVFDGMPIGYVLQDYWAWKASDLLNNTLRGSYCEFIVSAALGVDLSGVDEDWGAYDIEFPFDWMCNGETRNTVKIEVKSCSYLQAWEQSQLSNIQFNIRPTRAWTPAVGYSEEVKRQSDIYVFCLYTQTDRSKSDPLVLDDWDFYVVSTKRLNDFCGPQKTISLPGLLAINPIKADYSGIRDAVISSLQDYTPHSL